MPGNMIFKTKMKNQFRKFIKKSDWYTTTFMDCKKFWEGFPMGLDVVNLGSTSSVNAFNYDGIDKKCANWAMRPQTLYADFLVLQNYCSYLKPGSIVIIPLCPFSSLSSPRYLTKGADRYYTILASESIWPYSFEKYEQMANIKNQPQRYYPLSSCVMDVLRKLHVVKRKKSKAITVSEAMLEADANNRIESWKKEFSILDFNHPLRLHNLDMLDTAKELIREMVRFCKDREYVPVVVVPPVSRPLAAMFPDYAVEQYVTPLLEVGKTVGALVLDYIKDEEFGKSEYFQDSICMNRIGASVFTQRVLKDTEEYGNK